MSTMVICSGGLDSVTLAYRYANQGGLHSLLSFNYAQRHVRELQSARQCAEDLRVNIEIIDISSIGKRLSTNSLTGNVEVPDGHYAQQTMQQTIVANRNTIMLAIAFAFATSNNNTAVAMAVHSGDHYIYPDCRKEFIEQYKKMQNLALEGVKNSDLHTPFIDMDKSQIVSEGHALSVPFEKTWSCYRGGLKHCGRCGTCVERREAFHLAKVNDPTDYDDAEFWQTAINAKPSNS